MKANLVTDAASFIWADLSIDRSYSIEDLRLSQILAKEHGDAIYSSPDFLRPDKKWVTLYELSTMSHTDLMKTCPWMTRDDQIFLARIINGNTSPRNSSSLAELKNEFPKQNNSWFGIQPKDVPRYVHNEASWTNLHQENVREYYPTIDKDSEYFKKFYKAQLRVGATALKRSIEKGREHAIFKRLDIPTVVANDKTLHGEQIQMHFNDKHKSALNLNGEWKHGGCDIPNKARLQLIKWGFKVP